MIFTILTNEFVIVHKLPKILVFLNFSDAKAEDDKEVYKHLNLFGEAFEKIKNKIEWFI